MYTTALNDDSSYSLVRIEKDWTFTRIGNSLDGWMMGLAFDSRGNSFGTGVGNALYALDLTEGSSRLLQSSRPFLTQMVEVLNHCTFSTIMFHPCYVCGALLCIYLSLQQQVTRVILVSTPVVCCYGKHNSLESPVLVVLVIGNKRTRENKSTIE